MPGCKTCYWSQASDVTVGTPAGHEICVLCNTGFFYDGSDDTCTACMTNCKYCTGPLYTDCDQPTHGYKMVDVDPIASSTIDTCTVAPNDICVSTVPEHCAEGYVDTPGA